MGYELKIMPYSIWVSFLSTKFAHNLSDKILSIMFAIVVTKLLVWSIFKYFWKTKKDFKLKHPFIGLYAGVIPGFTGIGAGGLISSFLLHWNVVSNKFVAPTTNSIVMFTTLSSLLAHIHVDTIPLNDIRFDLALVVLLAAQVTAMCITKYQKNCQKI